MVEEDGERPRFVVPTRVGEAEVREEGLAMLCSVAVGEAARFCARLEEEGIECGARAAEGGRYADVFVHAEDLEMAREVIARPVEHVDEGETAAEETEARLVANWICPRCGRRGLDLVPVAGWVKGVWVGLVVTLVAGLVAWLVAGWNGAVEYPAWLTVTWVVAVIGLVWMSIPAERRRRCGGCGWESGNRFESGG